MPIPRTLLPLLAPLLALHLQGCGGNPDPGWTEPVLLEASAGVASGVRIAQNDAGQTLLAWEQEQAGKRSVKALFIRSVLQPDEALTLDSPGAGVPRQPDVAMDASGRAVVVWLQAQGGADSVWARRYDPATGWAPAEVLDPLSGGVDAAPRVAMHRDGRFLVAWLREGPDGRPIVARAYRPGQGWSPEWRLDNPSAGGTRAPAVAVSTGGRGMVLWPQQDTIFGGALPPWARDLDLTSGAGTTVQVETLRLDSLLPRLVALNDGSVLAAWSARLPNSLRTLATSQYTDGGGWTLPLEPRPNVPDLLAIEPAAGPGATSAVMWSESEGGRHRLGLRRMNGAQVLGDAPIFVADLPDTVRLEPQMRLDARGDALWIWQQGPASASELWTNTLSANNTLGVAQRLDQGASAGASSAALALDPSRYGIAAWTQNTASDHRVWLAWRYP